MQTQSFQPKTQRSESALVNGQYTRPISREDFQKAAEILKRRLIVAAVDTETLSTASPHVLSATDISKARIILNRKKSRNTDVLNPRSTLPLYKISNPNSDEIQKQFNENLIRAAQKRRQRLGSEIQTHFALTSSAPPSTTGAMSASQTRARYNLGRVTRLTGNRGLSYLKRGATAAYRYGAPTLIGIITSQMVSGWVNPIAAAAITPTLTKIGASLLSARLPSQPITNSQIREAVVESTNQHSNATREALTTMSKNGAWFAAGIAARSVATALVQAGMSLVTGTGLTSAVSLSTLKLIVGLSNGDIGVASSAAYDLALSAEVQTASLVCILALLGRKSWRKLGNLGALLRRDFLAYTGLSEVTRKPLLGFLSQETRTAWAQRLVDNPQAFEKSIDDIINEVSGNLFVFALQHVQTSVAAQALSTGYYAASDPQATIEQLNRYAGAVYTATLGRLLQNKPLPGVETLVADVTQQTNVEMSQSIESVTSGSVREGQASDPDFTAHRRSEISQRIQARLRRELQQSEQLGATTQTAIDRDRKLSQIQFRREREDTINRQLKTSAQSVLDQPIYGMTEDGSRYILGDVQAAKQMIDMSGRTDLKIALQLSEGLTVTSGLDVLSEKALRALDKSLQDADVNSVVKQMAGTISGYNDVKNIYDTTRNAGIAAMNAIGAVGIVTGDPNLEASIHGSRLLQRLPTSSDLQRGLYNLAGFEFGSQTIVDVNQLAASTIVATLNPLSAQTSGEIAKNAMTKILFGTHTIDSLGNKSPL